MMEHIAVGAAYPPVDDNQPHKPAACEQFAASLDERRAFGIRSCSFSICRNHRLLRAYSTESQGSH
jgi:hypothetical protein